MILGLEGGGNRVMLELDYTNLINICLLIATAIFSIATIRYANRSYSVTLFFEYTKRFSQVLNRLPYDILSPTFNSERLEQEGLMQGMKDYFDLCSEEYYLRNRFHWIARDIWKEWEQRMGNFFQKPAFREAWRRIRNDVEYYPGFRAFADRLTGIANSDCKKGS